MNHISTSGFVKGAATLSLALGLAATSLLASKPARAGAIVPPDYHWQWATIGAPGNRATLPFETPTNPDRSLGGVSYTYRIATTEVTIDQWFEFVRAYAPYVGDDYVRNEFMGSGFIYHVGFSNGVPQYQLAPGEHPYAVTIGWRYAARYCNWLHNGRASHVEAFQSGAYETSTFTRNPDGTYNDQAVRSPGASYWIPSVDEWVKAAYYDPNRYGPGLEGYWRYPNASDVPLVGGRPGEPGAQTGAPVIEPGDPIPIGAYPDVNRPWGLLDISGGQREWTEGWPVPGEVGRGREIRGSRSGMGEYSYVVDRVEVYGTASPAFGSEGFRIASVVPAPSSGMMVLMCLGLRARRKR